jgi:hypothetical protein
MVSPSKNRALPLMVATPELFPPGPQRKGGWSLGHVLAISLAASFTLAIHANDGHFVWET